jgi:hypothetical protein
MGEQANHKCSYERETRGSKSERDVMTRRAEKDGEGSRCYNASFETGGRSHKPRNTGSL